MKSIKDKMVVSKLLTIKDVANYLQCSEKTVHRLKDSGELKYKKVRGSVRFFWKDVCKYLEISTDDFCDLQGDKA